MEPDSNSIDITVTPKIMYQFQAVAREDKGVIGGIDWNKAPTVEFKTSSSNREGGNRAQDSKCGVVSEKCDFPFVFDGTKTRSCIEFSRLTSGGVEVPDDEGDSLYCKTPQWGGKGTFYTWSWDLCNYACFSDEGSEYF